MLESSDSETLRTLDRDGFVRIRDAVDIERIDRLAKIVDELLEQEGDAAGAEFKQEPGARRLANLVDKHEAFADVIVESTVLPFVDFVLTGDFKLSSLNARVAEPGTSERQPLHADMGALPDFRGYWVCNVIWMLDDFTEENGALRVVPGSHRWDRLPEKILEDPSAPHPSEELITGKKGTLVILNAHVWHGALPNRTSEPRRALHAFYCRRDKPQQQYQKALLRPETVARLTVQQRDLLALDDPLNDELSSANVPRSGFLK